MNHKLFRRRRGGRISLIANTDRFIGDIIVEPGDGGRRCRRDYIQAGIFVSASVTLIRDIVWNHGEHTFANLIIPQVLLLVQG